MARAASALSPAVRMIKPQRVVLSAQTRIGASATPIRNNTLTRNAARTCGISLHQPKSIDGSRAGGEHTEPRRAGEIRDAVAAHRAHDQRALETEIDAAAALGDALAEADEKERRRDADGAAEHRERYGPISD